MHVSTAESIGLPSAATSSTEGSVLQQRLGNPTQSARQITQSHVHRRHCAGDAQKHRGVRRQSATWPHSRVRCACSRALPNRALQRQLMSATKLTVTMLARGCQPER